MRLENILNKIKDNFYVSVGDIRRVSREESPFYGRIYEVLKFYKDDPLCCQIDMLDGVYMCKMMRVKSIVENVSKDELIEKRYQ